MPDWLGAWLTKPRGWPFAVAMAGAALWGFHLLDIAPFNRVSDEWLVIAAAVAVFGLSASVLAGGAWLWPRLTAASNWAGKRLIMSYRRSTPMSQLKRLTLQERDALAWMLVNEQGADGQLVSPFAGLVEAGFLIPQSPGRRHRDQAMLVSRAARKQRSAILVAIGPQRPTRDDLDRLTPPWQRRAARYR